VTEHFPLGSILSVTTGCLVVRDGMDGLYQILNYMTGDNLFTHALPRASEECRPHLLAQHPSLAEVVVPEWDDLPDDRDKARAVVFDWLSEQERLYGEMLPVEPIPAEDHTVIDPISELRMMRPDAPIIAVVEENDQ
jgi:hypothetical protein